MGLDAIDNRIERIYGVEQGGSLTRLIGKTVKGVRLDSEKQKLVFVIEEGEPLGYWTDGDCCSHSWIEHINGLDFLIGQKVTNVVERELPNASPADAYECIQCYGWTIETAVGRCDIEMRNESNGYYGGSLDAVTYHDPFTTTAPVSADF